MDRMADGWYAVPEQPDEQFFQALDKRGQPIV